MKLPRKGQRIVVVSRHASGWKDVWRTVVEHLRERTLMPRNGPLIVQLAEENVTWARGWNTHAAGALRAAVALENSR